MNILKRATSYLKGETAYKKKGLDKESKRTYTPEEQQRRENARQAEKKKRRERVKRWRKKPSTGRGVGM